MRCLCKKGDMGIEGDKEIEKRAVRTGAKLLKHSQVEGFLLSVPCREPYSKTISLSPPISTSPFFHNRRNEESNVHASQSDI